MVPPEVNAVSLEPRRPRRRPLTASWWMSAPRRPRLLLMPSLSMVTTCPKSSRASSRYGHARRKRSNSSSSFHSRALTSATICWASTSSGRSGITRQSSSPRLALSINAAHSTRSSRDSGNRRPLGVPFDGMARAADPLQQGGDGPRRTQLADEVDLADVDAQFQRGGSHQRLERALLKPLLGGESVLLAQAAVVSSHLILAQTIENLPGHALRHAPGIHEDQRRAMRLNEFGQAIVDLGPNLRRHHRFERRSGDFDSQVAPAAMTGVDDGAAGFCLSLAAATRPEGGLPFRWASGWPTVRSAGSAGRRD